MVSQALLNLGAARIDAVGLIDLIMNARSAIEAARVFGSAILILSHVDD